MFVFVIVLASGKTACNANSFWNLLHRLIRSEDRIESKGKGARVVCCAVFVLH